MYQDYVRVLAKFSLSCYRTCTCILALSDIHLNLIIHQLPFAYSPTVWAVPCLLYTSLQGAGVCAYLGSGVIQAIHIITIWFRMNFWGYIMYPRRQNCHRRQWQQCWRGVRAAGLPAEDEPSGQNIGQLNSLHTPVRPTTCDPLQQTRHTETTIHLSSSSFISWPVSGVVQVPRRCPGQYQEWCRNWPTEILDLVFPRVSH